MGRPGDRVEPFRRDRAPASDAVAERALIESLKRGLDLLEVLLIPIAKGEIALLLEDLAGRRRLGPVSHRVGRNDPDRDLGAEAVSLRGKGGARIGGL